MTREFEFEPKDPVFGQSERVELGRDHNGELQWYMATREGWQEVGKDGVLKLDKTHFAVGTRITLEEPLPDD